MCNRVPVFQRACFSITLFSVANTSFLDVIHVDTTRPEKNREVMIYDLNRLTGKLGENWYYRGYCVIHEIDLRHILDNPTATLFQAKLRRDPRNPDVLIRNQVVLTMPAWPYTLTDNTDRDAINGVLGELIGADIDHQRIKFIENISSRQTKDLLLEFPESVKLSATLLHDHAGKDEIFPFKLIPVKSLHPKHIDKKITSGDKRVPFHKYYVAYTFARDDEEPRRKGGAVVETKSQAALIAEQMMGTP